MQVAQVTLWVQRSGVMMGRCLGLALGALLVVGCGDGDPPPDEWVHHLADACMAVQGDARGGDGGPFLAAADGGSTFAFSAPNEANAARFFMKASDLGAYLLYDEERRYLISDGTELSRVAQIQSDVTMIDDDFRPGAQWELLVSHHNPDRMWLRHLASGLYLGTEGLVDRSRRAAEITLLPQTDCAEFPELTTDAEGQVQPRQFDDGSVFGIVDTHSHILSNMAFGGGGIFHGAPFHPLGVEHALSDCDLYHGEEGRADLLGFGFDQGNRGGDLDEEALLLGLVTGTVGEFNHHTVGYPHFTSWPNAHSSSTHQAQYYKWLERAYLGGLRLVVQHATSNQVICDLMVGTEAQQVRYSCNDMVATDRILQETRNMERYIDAQEGGPGQGWFRIVTSPEEARAVINEGKMAVVLGIEVSNLFDCFLVPPPGMPVCDEAYVLEQLDRYHDLGVRAMFPVHKFDNAFSAGDGDRVIMELANFIQTGHWLNFTESCPEGVPSVFDKGDVNFGGLNMPRDDYFADPPNDMSGFADDPVATLLPFLGAVTEGEPLVGDYCQNAGLTQMGEFLIEQMMRRGMIIEVDHLPRRGYARTFEILEEHDYPAAGTHGLNNFGALYALGGVSKTGFRRCRDPETPGTVDDGYQARIQLIRDNGGFPAEGFGFDLNGFAGAPGPRFGPDSVCGEPQEDPLTYPFDSYAGDVTFFEPQVGNRTIDFNTEGFAHIGLLPDLIEDVRRDGVTDEDLEPLFKSAEGYLRMWEKAERRATEAW
jgi:microsomal dipeptidase-like Zn-dependent dipeptidase